MNARLTRHATKPLARCLHNAQSMSSRPRFIRHTSNTALHSEHGRQIWVFNHLQTNQVVYSLSKTMDNSAALNQLPFNGKKTVPRALRKDLWQPMATISFLPGAGAIGLSAYQKLREYRRLHELSWDESLAVDKDGKIVPKKKRGRLINDQKANTVADIAAVLGKVGTPEGTEIGLKGVVEGINDASRVEVRWSNTLDAEFADSWSKNVIHDKLEWSQNNRDELREGPNSTSRAKMHERLIEQWEKMGTEQKRSFLGISPVIGKMSRAKRLVEEQELHGGSSLQPLIPGEDLAELQVAKTIEKKKLQYERRLASDADRAARKEEWLASLTPEQVAELQKKKEENGTAQNYDSQRQKDAREEKRVAKREATKAIRIRKQDQKYSAEPLEPASTTAHDTQQTTTETRDENDRLLPTVELHNKFTVPETASREVRAQARKEEAKLREETFQKIKEEKAAMRLMANAGDSGPDTARQTKSPEQKAEAQRIVAEKINKRIAYEQDQAQRREEWLAAGGIEVRKPGERPPVRELLKGYAKRKPEKTTRQPVDMERKIEEKEQRRLAYERDQAQRRAEWIAAGSPVRPKTF